VVVVTVDPDVGAAFGSNVALHAACLGAQAIMADAPLRDATRIAQVGLPCGAAGTDPRRPAGAVLTRVERTAAFGVEWADGDWFLRDQDGVIRLDAMQASVTADRLSSTATGELAALLGGA
jgi:regulator of RNase E activity RraA